jgi:hypothetical protein
MINKSKVAKNLSLTLGLIAFVLAGGIFTEGQAQSGRDPFSKPGYKQKKKPQVSKPPSSSKEKSNNPSVSSGPVKPSGPVVVTAPSIQDRIDYYKRIREDAAINGQPIPKVTSVLLLEEMTISGIFKTPRGYAAIVEAKPIELSYTIYPGEKFFDGQLVAVEENRLVFRKVSKLTNGKFVSTVENMPLRQYSIQQELQGTVPVSGPETKESAGNKSPNPEEDKVIVSPLDEMIRQPAEDAEKASKDKDSEKGKKGNKRRSKKKTRVAKKN